MQGIIVRVVIGGDTVTCQSREFRPEGRGAGCVGLYVRGVELDREDLSPSRSDIGD